ncbi:MAG: PaaI family thioesterase [Gemmatimonadetes bacterium]|nr:PaaI family thioesterase [Gemmatimonadota bacterium]
MTEYLQERYAPKSSCFGCGPSNRAGLGLRSRPEGEVVVAAWTSEEHHRAFPGVLCGGIIGTLLDCHSNWTAAYGRMRSTGAEKPGVTVTAEYSVRLLRPTPVGVEVRLEARAIEIKGRRVTVEAKIFSEGRVTATCTGLFIAVKDDHPAARCW